MPNPPAEIDGMKPLYFLDAQPFAAHLKKYMPRVPRWLLLVWYEEDKNYCIIGTDENFANWEAYTNYVFPALQPAIEFPHVIFRIDDYQWRPHPDLPR